MFIRTTFIVVKEVVLFSIKRLLFGDVFFEANVMLLNIDLQLNVLLLHKCK